MDDSKTQLYGQPKEERTDLTGRIATLEGKLQQLEKAHSKEVGILHAEIDALKPKVERLETMAATTVPAVEEHETRLDEHDKQLEVLTRTMNAVQHTVQKMDSNVQRLADEQTASGLATLGLLKRMCKKLEVETEGLGGD